MPNTRFGIETHVHFAFRIFRRAQAPNAARFSRDTRMLNLWVRRPFQSAANLFYFIPLFIKTGHQRATPRATRPTHVYIYDFNNALFHLRLPPRDLGQILLDLRKFVA